MRLPDFILTNVEPILVEWEDFARTIWPGAEAEPAALRDHAEAILRAAVNDMKADQTAAQQSSKSRGAGEGGAASHRLDDASHEHAITRVGSGFNLANVIAEYRALRGSVIRLWRESQPKPDQHDLDDLTRFNESIDQSLAKSVNSYIARVDQSRHLFLAILGHDLRTPLNSMMLSAELVRQAASSDPDVAEAVEQMSNSGTAMSGMISDLLDFTATALGTTMPISRTGLDLSQLCREVVAELQAAHPNCTFNCRTEGDLRGEWDAARLRQVVSNLIGNAVQHGGDACAVTLTMKGDKSEVVLSVHNQGPAIPPELIPTVFDPMVRGKPSTYHRKRRPGSIGLGLYIVRAVVHAHGGSIDVQSTEQSGTTFTVRLPRHPKA